jgi:hypothetical protein
MHLCFRAAQKCGADHRCTRAQDQRCGHTAATRNSTSGDDGNAHGIYDCGHERKQSHKLLFRFRRFEGTAMSTSLHSLRDDDVGTRSFSRLCFNCRRSRREPRNTTRLQFGNKRRGLQSHNR